MFENGSSVYVDSAGARVTALDDNASGDALSWTLVANGDVNESGAFVSDYVVTVDVV